MNKVIEKLSEYQLEALVRGIEFELDLHFKNRKPVIEVVLRYMMTGDSNKGYVYNTTFTEGMKQEKREERYEEIKHFIYTVIGPKK